MDTEKFNLAKTLGNIALLETKSEQYEDALCHLQKQLQVMKSIHHNFWEEEAIPHGSIPLWEYLVTKDIAECYFKLENFNLAVLSYKQCRAISQVFTLVFPVLSLQPAPCFVLPHSHCATVLLLGNGRQWP